jgi:pimeloyl-ACP methyl ester carboxylesterase
MFKRMLLIAPLLLPVISHAQDNASTNEVKKATASVADPITNPIKISACRHPSFSQEVQCGYMQRPLNPEKTDGVKIDIHFMILPSQDRNKLIDAVFLLAGGPGQSAIEVAGFGDAVLKKLNRRRDLVFVDQRGTGKSASLSCENFENEKKNETFDKSSTLKKIDACRVRLQKLPYGDLTMYSTSIAVKDLEAVRKALHYSSVNLVGASYGTRFGLEFLRQYPQSVRRLVLDGVVPPTMRLPSADSQSALDGVFKECLMQKACNEAFPDLEGTWTRLLSQLAQNKVTTKVKHPRFGHEVDMTVDNEMLISMINKTLYSANMTSTLPYAISQASKGQYTPLITLAGVFGQKGLGSINMGMHYSVFCGEAYAQPTSSSDSPKNMFEKINESTYDDVCKTWPHANIPKEFFKITPSAVPVLLLSGGIDPVTPSRHGTAVAKELGSKARHIVIDNAGHGLLAQGCVSDVVSRFLLEKEDDAALKIDATCVRQIPRPLVWLPAKMPTSNTVVGAKP